MRRGTDAEQGTVDTFVKGCYPDAVAHQHDAYRISYRIPQQVGASLKATEHAYSSKHTSGQIPVVLLNSKLHGESGIEMDLRRYDIFIKKWFNM